MVAEELPGDARGLGFGVLAMLNALGAGTAALAWGLGLSPQHMSWRWMYAAATPVLLVVLDLLILVGRPMPDKGAVIGSPLLEILVASVVLGLCSMCLALLLSALVGTSERGMLLGGIVAEHEDGRSIEGIAQ